MSVVDVLTLPSENADEILKNIHKLACLVFEPEIAEEQHDIIPATSPQLQLDNWIQRLSKDNATIVYMKDQDAKFPSNNADPIIGFFLNHPRSRAGSRDSYHIYLAAVHPSARGKSVFSSLLNKTRDIAKEVGYAELTVSTIPTRFDTMYAILSRPGSGWKEFEWIDVGDDRKVVMEMSLM